MRASVINCSITFTSHSYLTNLNFDHSISGFISGALISPVIFSTDCYKIHRQMNHNALHRFNIRDVYKRHGKIGTFLRESIGYSVYFKSYHMIESYVNNPLISGGIALCGTFSYPLDVIRNRCIANNISFFTAYNMGNLWKGYLFCAIRAFKVNAIGFYVYEYFIHHPFLHE